MSSEDKNKEDLQFPKFYDLMKDTLPSDHSKQVDGYYYSGKCLLNDSPQVLDVGCGTGESINYFKSINTKTRWYGIDLISSPQVNERKRNDCSFISFDGQRLPFKDSYFDVVFSKQVFEHVKRPEMLMREINRILKPGSYFTGSVSCLEPYHSLSITNFTPYGFKTLLEESDLELIEIRPGVDGLTLIMHSMLRGRLRFKWFLSHESPLNFLISIIYRIMRKNHDVINFAKLAYCGHFVFLSRKK